MSVKQKGSPKGVLIGLLIIPAVLFGTCVCVAVIVRREEAPRSRERGEARGQRRDETKPSPQPTGKGYEIKVTLSL